jgi:hypothetical protein
MVMEQLDLSKGSAFDTSVNHCASATAMLRELLLLHDVTFDVSAVPRLSKLECAALDGKYIWASKQELDSLGDKVTLTRRPVATVLTPPHQHAAIVNRNLKFLLNLRVDGVARKYRKKSFCRWWVEGESLSTKMINPCITTQHNDKNSSPAWDGIEISQHNLSSLDQLASARLRIEFDTKRLLFGRKFVYGVVDLKNPATDTVINASGRCLEFTMQLSQAPMSIACQIFAE